jgi:cation diffusion facilitator family transporter
VTVPGLHIPGPERNGGASLRTVLTAVGANLGIAVAKAVAAMITGSVALWAEALHSFADTGTEVLMLVGLRRSGRAEDHRHPFGYGQEHYFWAFLASLAIFLIGGVLSIAEGVESLVAPRALTSPWIGASVLAVAAAFEGYSWRVARRQLTTDARERRRSVIQHLTRASDPSAATVYLEDSAALIGITLAMAGLLTHVFTGWGGAEGLASIAIGVLLIVVAVLLARRSKGLLIDESVPPDVLRPIREAIQRPDWVADIRRLDVVFVGPSQLLVVTTVAPVAQVVDAGGRELIRRVQGLREDLLRSPVVADVTIGVWAEHR